MYGSGDRWIRRTSGSPELAALRTPGSRYGPVAPPRVVIAAHALKRRLALSTEDSVGPDRE
jgi:predicted nucleic acid-binding protein